MVAVIGRWSLAQIWKYLLLRELKLLSKFYWSLILQRLESEEKLSEYIQLSSCPLNECQIFFQSLDIKFQVRTEHV